MNMDAWYIAVIIYGREFKYYKLERDEELISSLIQVEQNFWNENVLKRALPEPDGSKIADCVINEYFKDSVAESIPLTGFDEKLDRQQELKVLIDRMETEKKQIEQELKIYLGEAEMAENEKYRVSWKSVSTKRVDEKRLKEEKPEIYEQYQKVIPSRRLLVKAA